MALKHPFTMVCAGPTGAGKTEFTIKLIENMNHMIRPQIDEVLWSYNQWQDSYLRIPNVTFHQGIPEIQKSSLNRLLIIDDQMDCADLVSSIFTRESHHKNISVIYIVQNLFYHHKEMRTISLNAHFLVVFRNPRDVSTISVLARQMFPGRAQFLRNVYADATSVPYSYLLIDFSQTTPDHLRLRTNIFPEEVNYVYIWKGDKYKSLKHR